jgi:dihydroorotate dehydrogenase (fumarate)
MDANAPSCFKRNIKSKKEQTLSYPYNLITMAPSLETKIANISLDTCVYNASGPRTGSSQALSKVASSAAGAVLAKSATLASQTGNPLPRTWHHDAEESHASMNSEGLPNMGIDYYVSKDTIDETMSTTVSAKPYFVSISGKNIDDNIAMLERIHARIKAGEKRISGVELNLACPNIIGKPIIAYDFEQLESVLQAVSQLSIFAEDKLPLGVKMPPYFDGPHYDRAAAVLNKYSHVVKYVASINTIGNCLMVDPIAEMPVIRSKGGFAGLSGRAVKFTALANVKKMRELLVDEIDVVGAGGVFSGEGMCVDYYS